MTGNVRPPEANHPLTAIRRQGVVVDVNNRYANPPTINVYIGGDTSNAVACSFLADYAPWVNDVVYLVQNQSDYLVIGSVLGPPSPGMLVQQFSYADFASGTRTFLEAITTAIAIPPGMADGNHGITVQLMHHTAVVNNAGVFQLDLSTSDSGWTTLANMGAGTPQIGSTVTAGIVSSVGDMTIVGTWTIPNGATTLTPRLNGQRTSGTGALRSAGGNSLWQWWIV